MNEQLTYEAPNKSSRCWPGRWPGCWKVSAVFMTATLLVVACATNSKVGTEITEIIVTNGYQVDEVTVTSNSGGSATIKLPNGEIKVISGHQVVIKGLKPAARRKQKAKPPALRPVFAIALDPSYRGPSLVSLEGSRVLADGMRIPVGSDKAAMKKLGVRKQAQWQLIATQAGLSPTVGKPMDLIIDLRYALKTRLVPGKRSLPYVPVLFASRLFDDGTFLIRRGFLHYEGEVMKSVEPILNARDLQDSALQVAAGKALELTSLSLRSNTKQGFQGRLEIHARRGLGSSRLLLGKNLSLRPFKAITFSGIKLATDGFVSGAYELLIVLSNTQKQVVRTLAVPLNIKGATRFVDFETLGSTISVRTGGKMGFWIQAGKSHAGLPYIVLLSSTPSLAGTRLGTMDLPIALDMTTSIGLQILGSSTFKKGIGFLDGRGYANPVLQLPPMHPAVVGVRIAFAPLVFGPVWSTSSKPGLLTLSR